MLAEIFSALALLITVVLQAYLWYKHRRVKPGIPFVDPPEIDAPRRARTAPPTFGSSNRTKDRQAAARVGIDRDEALWKTATGRADGDRHIQQGSHSSGSSEPRRGDGDNGLPGSSEPRREDESHHREGVQSEHEPSPPGQAGSEGESTRQAGTTDYASSNGEFELVPETGESDTLATT